MFAFDSVGKPPVSVIASAFCEAIFPGLLRRYAPRNDTGRVFRHYHSTEEVSGFFLQVQSSPREQPRFRTFLAKIRPMAIKPKHATRMIIAMRDVIK